MHYRHVSSLQFWHARNQATLLYIYHSSFHTFEPDLCMGINIRFPAETECPVAGQHYFSPMQADQVTVCTDQNSAIGTHVFQMEPSMAVKNFSMIA